MPRTRRRSCRRSLPTATCRSASSQVRRWSELSGRRRSHRHVRDLKLVDDRIALVDREQIETGFDDLIPVLVEETAQALAARLDAFDEDNWMAALYGLACAFQRLELHSLDVELDEIHPRQAECVNRHFLDCYGTAGRIID